MPTGAYLPFLQKVIGFARRKKSGAGFSFNRYPKLQSDKIVEKPARLLRFADSR